MAQLLRALLFHRTWFQFPASIRQHTTVCNSRSRGSNTLHRQTCRQSNSAQEIKTNTYVGKRKWNLQEEVALAVACGPELFLTLQTQEVFLVHMGLQAVHCAFGLLVALTPLGRMGKALGEDFLT